MKYQQIIFGQEINSPMKNTFKLIIALVAVIGFSFAACDNGSTDSGGDPYVDFNTHVSTLDPSSNPNLTAYGINGSAWEFIKNTAGGTYNGYWKDPPPNDGDTNVIFTGTTKAKYDALKALAVGTYDMEPYQPVGKWPGNTDELTLNGLTAIMYKEKSGTGGFLLVYSAGGSHALLRDGMPIPSGVIYISFDSDVTD